MKIIIELDGSREQQPEIRRVAESVAQQQDVTNSAVGASSSSPLDAGHARIPDGYSNESSSSTVSQLLSGTTSGSTAGGIDAGASRVQDETIRASAMPDTGNMETFNSSNAFSGGALAGSVNN